MLSSIEGRRKRKKRGPEKSKPSKRDESLDKVTSSSKDLNIVGAFLFYNDFFLGLSNIQNGSFENALRTEYGHTSVYKFIKKAKKESKFKLQGKSYSIRSDIINRSQGSLELVFVVEGFLLERHLEPSVFLMLHHCLEIFLDSESFWKTSQHGHIVPFETFGMHDMFLCIGRMSSIVRQEHYNSILPSMFGIDILDNPFSTLDVAKKGYLNYFDFVHFLTAEEPDHPLKDLLLKPEIPIIDNVGANRNLNVIYSCTNFVDILTRHLIPIIQEDEEDYMFWLKNIQKHLSSIGRLQTLVCAQLAQNNEQFRVRVNTLEREKEEEKRRESKRRKAEEADTSKRRKAEALEAEDANTRSEPPLSDRVNESEHGSMEKERSGDDVEKSLMESEIIFLKQQLSELLQENHKLRINAEKEDSSGILKQQLSEVLKENQELRATKSVQKDDTNVDLGKFKEIAMERDRYHCQIRVLRETAEIYRLTINELKARCSRVDEERLTLVIHLEDTEEKLRVYEGSKRAKKNMSEIEDKIRKIASVETQIMNERREKQHLRNEVKELENSLFRMQLLIDAQQKRVKPHSSLISDP